MSFIINIIREMERSTAGSEDTSRRVMELCGTVRCENALFVGDESDTPRIINEKTEIGRASCRERV